MKTGKSLTRFFYLLMGALFLPVFFCVVFIGNHMDYNEDNKLNALLPNYVFVVIALMGFGCICLLAWAVRKIRVTHKVDLTADGLLILLFILLYFVNVRIAREIAFKFPWDIKAVTTSAESVARGTPLGYFTYFSMYTNNIPILYILKEIYIKAGEIANYPYIDEFLWIQVNCALISIGGFFSCLTVKKLTQKLMPAFVAFFLYLALAGMTPWKIAPYTDTYGIVFPVMCIYFYVCYREQKKPVLKCLWAALAMVSGMAGGFIKPSIYIVVMAVLAAELAGWLAGDWKRWRYILAEIGFAAALFFAKGACMDYLIKDVGLDFNPEIAASWQNYFYMGLNEEKTGSYYAEDVAMYGEFQYSGEERKEAALERAIGRMEERGFWGNLYFWLRKMVMVFNDGTFGWQCEVWIDAHYPSNLASNDGFMELSRNIFWPSSRYAGRFNAFCQLAWVFCLLGISGICFCRKKLGEKYTILVVGFLGIFCYQMLFEARARYLLVFLPLLIVISICGMWQYVDRIHAWMEKRTAEKAKNKQEEEEALGLTMERNGENGRNQENAPQRVHQDKGGERA